MYRDWTDYLLLGTVVAMMIPLIILIWWMVLVLVMG